MTLPKSLELLWASGGGTADPGDTKFQLGWVSEIPTFEHFNYILNVLNTNLLSYAENDIFPWQGSIAYKAGARVVRNNRTFYCIEAHNDSNNTNPQDPDLDTPNSYWVNGTVFSSVVNAFDSLRANEGLKLDRINPRTNSNVWDGNDLTSIGASNILALSNSGATNDNWLLGNVNGELVAVNVANDTNPDGRDLRPNTNVNSHRMFHEGHPPTQTEVAGTIPDAPANNTIYARQNANWVKVTMVSTGLAPPESASGSGAGWYNLEDGQLYLDIDDGDSSQWVIANPPITPELIAVNVDYNNTASGLTATNVQSAIDEVASAVTKLQEDVWVSVTTYVNGFYGADIWAGLKYKVTGNTLYITGEATNSAPWNSKTVLFSLPEHIANRLGGTQYCPSIAAFDSSPCQCYGVLQENGDFLSSYIGAKLRRSKPWFHVSAVFQLSTI